MENPLDEASAKAIALAIKQLLAGEEKEKSPLELLEERIAQLNRDIKKAEGNRRLQKQLLLQLKTAMTKRDGLLKK
jgi:TolA-binding protein